MIDTNGWKIAVADPGITARTAALREAVEKASPQVNDGREQFNAGVSEFWQQRLHAPFTPPSLQPVHNASGLAAEHSRHSPVSGDTIATSEPIDSANAPDAAGRAPQESKDYIVNINGTNVTRKYIGGNEVLEYIAIDNNLAPYRAAEDNGQEGLPAL